MPHTAPTRLGGLLPGQIIQFAEFELDLGRYELRRGDRAVKLERNPMELLILLVEKQGQLVTREEIVQRLWGQDVFVDTRNGINTAIHKLRMALRDDSERPRILETVVGKGYRLVPGLAYKPTADASVGPLDRGPSNGKPFFNGQNEIAQEPLAESKAEPGDRAPASVPLLRLTPRRWMAGGIALVAVVALAFWMVPRVRVRLMGSHFNGANIQSIAVLPFENLSGDPGQDYFADGFTDELITDLAEETKIRIVSRSSVMRYKGTRKALPEIARELGVDAIVEGSVSLSEQQVRITAQLIDASSDRHLWAHSYERDRKDLFTIQSDVATTIASLVRAETSSQNSTDLPAVALRQRFTPKSYELYLGCRYLQIRSTEESVNQAIQCYQHLLTLDPNCASAYAELSNSYSVLGLDSLPQAKRTAIKALELDSTLPEAHNALANVKLMYEKDLIGAEREIKQALALNPSHAQAHAEYSYLLLAVGRVSDAIGEARTAKELSPFSRGNALQSGVVLFMAREYDKSIEDERTALQLDPQLDRAHYWVGYAYEQKGMYKEAVAEYKKVLPEDDHGIFLAALGRSLWLSGDSAGAAAVKKKIEHLPKEDFMWPYDAALFYAALGDKDRAFQWLEKDHKAKDGWLILLNVDPRLASLRSDHRFQDVVRRVGLPVN